MFVCAFVLAAVLEPHVVLEEVAWKSAAGHCSSKYQRATVAGVPAAAAAVIDAALRKMERDVAEAATSPGGAACEKEYREDIAADPRGSMLHGSFFDGDWTVGLQTKRWISVRFHTTSFAGGAHPSDTYAAATFDLAHGGYPVRTFGFYTSARRKRFDRIVLDADFRTMATLSKREGFTVDPDFLRTRDSDLAVDASQILVLPGAIAISGIGSSEAERNDLLTIDERPLFAVGTPNGPLDPKTR